MCDTGNLFILLVNIIMYITCFSFADSQSNSKNHQSIIRSFLLCLKEEWLHLRNSIMLQH